MYLVLVVIFALLWGSFLTVIKNRTRSAGSILFGRSQCPHCHHRLGAFDLIPILNFILLLGRCRYCHKKISPTYPIIEIFSLFIALIIFYKVGVSARGAVLFLSFSLLLLASVQDVEEKEVEIWYFVAGIIMALTFAFWGNLTKSTALNTLYAILTAGISPFLIYLVSREKWMGLGDSFFALWIGIIVGFPVSVFSVFLAYFIGALFGIILLATRKGGLKTQVPFGPYLAISGLIAFVIGENVVDWYLKLVGL